MNLEPKYNVELISKGRGHFYRVDGRDFLYPGVTTVLGVIAKPALIPWAANEAAKKIKAYLVQNATGRALTATEIDELVEQGRKAHIELKDAAADVGTRAHAAINTLIDGGKLDLTDDIKPAVDAFMAFVGESHIKIEHGDRKIASLAHGYGGSLDALGIENGKLVVVDFKTSSGIYPEMGLQVAAYCEALRETYQLDYLPAAYILRLGKTKPEFEVRKIASVEKCLGWFLNALQLYHFQKAA